MATTQGQVVDCSLYAAGEDLTGAQYQFVELDTGVIKLQSKAGEDCLGILQNKPALGEVANVRMFGMSMLVAHEALLENAMLCSSDAGRAASCSYSYVDTTDTSVQDPLQGNSPIAQAMEAASGAGIVIRAMFNKLGAVLYK